MAYVNKYYAGWASCTKQGYLYIDQLDYSGGASELVLKAESIVITPVFEDWNNPIIGIRAEFEIINDKADFFELLPLLSAEEREYLIRIVVIYPTAYTVFEGFLNCDTVTQKFLHRQTINFTASSYLSKLENIHPVSIDTLQNKIFIDVIDEILRSTGAFYNIRVNSNLRAEGDTLSAGQTLFNKNGFWTELFWDDEVERFTSLEILTTILVSFDCYIYWWQGCWYIERYEDIWSESVDYVEYITGQTYTPTQAGTVVNVVKTVLDLHSLVFTDQSQTLAIIPGYKTIQINLNDKRLVNLVRQDLYNISADPGTGLPMPTNRNWLYVNDSTTLYWGPSGYGYGSGALPPKANIENAIMRTSAFNIPTIPIPLNKGLFAGFKVTVNDEDIKLNIKFKYAFYEPSEFLSSDYDFKFHWYLRVGYPDNNYITKSGDTWKRLYAPDELTYMQEVVVNGSAFDPDNKSVEVSVTVPLGMVETYSEFYDGKLTGDQFLILCIGAEEIFKGDINFHQAGLSWFGDPVISISGGLQDNVIEGTVNSNFLNKKEISLDLYDMESYNYKNGVLRGTNLEYRTERWGTAGGADTVIARGICYNTTGTPVITDSKTVDGTGYGVFLSLLTGLLPNTLYHVRAYAISEVETTYGPEVTFTTDQIAVNEYFEGGIIGYIFQVGDPGYHAGQVHGIIVAPVDQNVHLFWGSLAKPIPTTPLANNINLGTGTTNTNLILAGDAQYSEFAVKVCADYENDGYADWVFPSQQDLVKIRETIDIRKAGFVADWYWTSSESSFVEVFSSVQKYSWAVSFGAMIGGVTAKKDTWKKNNYMHVRAIRYF